MKTACVLSTLFVGAASFGTSPFGSKCSVENDGLAELDSTDAITLHLVFLVGACVPSTRTTYPFIL